MTLQHSCGEVNKISLQSVLIKKNMYQVNLNFKWKFISELDTTPCNGTTFGESGDHFNIKIIFPGIGISIVKMRRSWDRLIFTMGIPILANQTHETGYVNALALQRDFQYWLRQHLYIEMPPEYSYVILQNTATISDE